jgi:hypothetical protein
MAHHSTCLRARMRFVRRPACFNHDGSDSDGDENEYQRLEDDWIASQNEDIDADLRSWFEGALGTNLTVGMGMSGMSISGLSKRFLPCTDAKLLYWQYLHQGALCEETSLAKCPWLLCHTCD